RGALEVLRVGHRNVGSGHALYRRIQIVECLLVDTSGQFRRESDVAPLLMDRHGMVSLAYGLENGLHVERDQRAEIDDLTLDSLFGKSIGRLEAEMDAARVGHQRAVRAFPPYSRLAERNRKLGIFRHVSLQAVKTRVLHIDHRVVVAYGGLQ